MARSEDKTAQAIESIKEAVPESQGALAFIRLDLADLSGIKGTANEFLSKENRLDVLFNNAGVAYPDKGSKTKQGYELQLGVNCIGSFALTRYLTPTLVETAKTSPANSVRVVWASSSAAEGISPKGFVENLETIHQKSTMQQYFFSKLGNYLHSTEYAARHKADGVLSFSLNPGNLDSELWRTQGPWMRYLLRKTVLHPTINGAYTNLFTAFSPDLTLENSGTHSKWTKMSRFEPEADRNYTVAPWGRPWKVSNDMVAASKTTAEGGNDTARRFWDWTKAEVEKHQTA